MLHKPYCKHQLIKSINHATHQSINQIINPPKRRHVLYFAAVSTCIYPRCSVFVYFYSPAIVAFASGLYVVCVRYFGGNVFVDVARTEGPLKCKTPVAPARWVLSLRREWTHRSFFFLFVFFPAFIFLWCTGHMKVLVMARGGGKKTRLERQRFLMETRRCR